MKIDPDKTLAILIGVPENDDKSLHPLYAAFDNVADVAKAFNKYLGLPLTKIKKKADGIERRDDLLLYIQKSMAAGSFDNIIFYYSGHGVLDENYEKYYLTVKSTDVGNLELTGVRVHEVCEVLTKTGANLLMIIDSCFSANIFNAVNSDKGLFIMASSSYNKASRYPLNEERSSFTNKLLEVLSQGTKDDVAFITIRNLFELTEQKLLADNDPAPVSSERHGWGSTEIAENQFVIAALPNSLEDELEAVFSAVSEVDQTIAEERQNLNGAPSFFKEVKKIILRRYPVIIAKYLKDFLYAEGQPSKDCLYYKELYELVLKLICYIIIEDLAKRLDKNEKVSSLLRKGLNKPTREMYIEVLDVSCAAYEGKLFLKELTCDAPLFDSIKEFETLIASGSTSIPDYHACTIRLICNLSFFARYIFLAVRIIDLQKGYCPPVYFRHEVSELQGENYKPYVREYKYKDNYLHNGTVLIFEKRINGNISPDDPYLNLWPLVIDANGFELKSNIPEIRFYSNTDHAEFMYGADLLEKSKEIKLKKYREVHASLPFEIQKIYFDSFKQSIGI